MEIRDRLIKIISSEGLTSAAFADSIGVQRSSISHIISGRNKPSLDFLQKILTSFPKYNAEWLIVGTGDIYKQPKQPNLFNEELVTGPKHSIQEEEAVANEQVRLDSPTIPLEALNHTKNDEENKENLVNEPKIETNPINIQKSAKKIKKIVIFYEDKTFNEYSPSADE